MNLYQIGVIMSGTSPTCRLWYFHSYEPMVSPNVIHSALRIKCYKITP